MSANLRVILMCSLIFSTVSLSNAFAFTPRFTHIPLHDVYEIKYLEDRSQNHDIESVSSENNSQHFIKHYEDKFNFGTTLSTIWLKLTPRVGINRTPDYLELVNPYIDLVRVYTSDGMGGFNSHEAGDTIAFEKRPHNFRNFLFDLPSSKETRAMPVYIEVKSGGHLYFYIDLWDHSEFKGYSLASQILIGMYLGMIGIMALYNLFIYLNIREKTYLFYVLYIISLGLFMCATNGTGHQYIWSNNTYLSSISTTLFAGLATLTAFLFSRQFLQTWKHLPAIDSFTLFMMGVTSLQIIFSIFGYIYLSSKMVVFLAIIMSTTVWLSSVLCWKNGYRPARFIVIAWSFFLFTVLVNAFTTLGFLPASVFTTFSIQIGSAVEVVLLSWALADRMAILKQEKEEMQLAYMKQLEVNNLQLEKIVAERTSELKRSTRLAQEKSMQLEKMNAELELLATRDSLTGLMNHSTLVEQFKHLIEDARRYEHALSVFLIDVDNFKTINDTYGHLIGNKVLLKLTEIFKEETRESDLVSRYGGEEFVIVLSRANLSEAMDKAEILRSRIDKTRDWEYEKLRITVSIGVTTIDWREKSNNYNDYLFEADSAMYHAKQKGKNRICSYNAEIKVVSGKLDS